MDQDTTDAAWAQLENEQERAELEAWLESVDEFFTTPQEDEQ